MNRRTFFSSANVRLGALCGESCEAMQLSPADRPPTCPPITPGRSANRPPVSANRPPMCPPIAPPVNR